MVWEEKDCRVDIYNESENLGLLNHFYIQHNKNVGIGQEKANNPA